MIKEEFEKFKNHRSVKKWSVDVFDKTKWSTGSWFTLQRTLRKSKEHKENGKLYEKLREDCKKYIFDEIFNFFPEEIDEIDLWYKKIITREYGLSYLSIGHRQKIVNILVKYFLTYFHTTKDTDLEFCKRFDRNISHIHIPLDQYVLRNLYEKEEYRKEFKDIEIIKIGKKPPCDPNEGKRKDCPGYKFLVKGEKISWSRINNYDIYFYVQKIIRKLSEIEKMSPIEFEMKKLWS
tara:strand:- start:366 stop:1070 length:705 start_codon:yes stop_codon:yes gene_type:complete